MQSSHTCHVNKTTNFKTLTVLRRVTLQSGYLMSRASRQRHRWNYRLHITGTATAAGASLRLQNAVHCHCLTPRVTDVWPWRWRLLVSVDDKRSGGRHVFLVHLTLIRATWVSALEAGYTGDCIERLNHSHWDSWGWDGVVGAGG